MVILPVSSYDTRVTKGGGGEGEGITNEGGKERGRKRRRRRKDELANQQIKKNKARYT